MRQSLEGEGRKKPFKPKVFRNILRNFQGPVRCIPPIQGSSHELEILRVSLCWFYALNEKCRLECQHLIFIKQTLSSLVTSQKAVWNFNIPAPTLFKIYGFLQRFNTPPLQTRQNQGEQHRWRFRHHQASSPMVNMDLPENTPQVVCVTT